MGNKALLIHVLKLRKHMKKNEDLKLYLDNWAKNNNIDMENPVVNDFKKVYEQYRTIKHKFK